MAYISRALQKVFGATGGIGEFGKFGSEALGTPEYSKDPIEIQSLSPYNNGWYAATDSGGEPPRIQDINSMFFLFSRQIAYILQAGIPEWNSSTEYFENKSYVIGSDGAVYLSIQGDNVDPNLNKNPTTDNDWWKKVITAAGEAASVEPNLLLNSIYPVGSFYVQYPNANSNDDATEFPSTMRPSALFGGTWSEQWATESVFFRTRGTNANEGRVSGRQLDQMQLLTGQFAIRNMSGGTSILISRAGAFTITQSGTSNQWASSSSNNGNNSIGVFNSSNSPNARTSTNTNGETRVTNRRIKVWKRTA